MFLSIFYCKLVFARNKYNCPLRFCRCVNDVKWSWHLFVRKSWITGYNYLIFLLTISALWGRMQDMCIPTCGEFFFIEPAYQTCRQASMARKMPHSSAKGTARNKVRQRYDQIRVFSKPVVLYSHTRSMLRGADGSASTSLTSTCSQLARVLEVQSSGFIFRVQCMNSKWWITCCTAWGKARNQWNVDI